MRSLFRRINLWICFSCARIRQRFDQVRKKVHPNVYVEPPSPYFQKKLEEAIRHPSQRETLEECADASAITVGVDGQASVPERYRESSSSKDNFEKLAVEAYRTVRKLVSQINY